MSRWLVLCALLVLCTGIGYVIKHTTVFVVILVIGAVLLGLGLGPLDGHGGYTPIRRQAACRKSVRLGSLRRLIDRPRRGL